MKRPRISMRARRAVNGCLFILPWVIGFAFFYIRCMVMTVQFSLSELQVGSVGGYVTKWIGLDNFIYAFRAHATFKQVLTTSMINMVVDVPLIIFFSLFVAMLLNRKFRGRGLVRAVFFLPVILNAGAVVEAMEMSQRMITGGLSSVSAEISSGTGGGVSVGYYLNLFRGIALPGAVLDYIVSAVSRISDIITASGVQIIIFIAALQSIPGALYEVSRIEGATAYEAFWKITFPMVTPHIITNVIYTNVVSFADSEAVELAYRTAFTEYNYGLSSAFSLISTAVVSIILVIVCALIQKRAFYYS